MPEPEEPARDDATALELCQATMESFNARDLDTMLERYDPNIEWWPLRSETEGAFRGDKVIWGRAFNDRDAALAEVESG